MRRARNPAATVLVLAVLVGCSGPGSDSGGADGSSSDGGVVAEPAPAGPGALPTVPGESDPDRQVVQTATASVAVDDPAEAAQQVSELVESAGGRVDQRTERAGAADDGGDGAAADLVVRVPSDELTGVLADLEGIGDVEDVSVSRSDVTATAVDLDARISALRTSAARLQALMDGAATTEALLAAEAALSDRQEQLESLQSQRALLADQVELSTLTVHLAPSGVAPAGGPDGFLDGLGTGWRALVTVLGAAVVAVGVLLPWLLVAALLTAAVLVPVRRRALRRTPVEAPVETPAGVSSSG
ncbi:DUF4349 domain-containing protein [Modestobacter versicolor]|uniref:DUF4349 domain-containing protein n=1 Tax=Modestobacter versicolor TaxID=429133 RepID=A0A323V8J7_9ACTN|nr:DUF4349 domain-containing protein [Modestobacter versicolor]MBB3675736.1 hypothetical protein [Modestobacter versicolor]PZA21145.1 DUF4349 domain-containing protein [Modestobacter versicolor]